MIIVVTGMVGLDKKSYLEKVCQYALKQGTETLLCNVGDMMYREAPDIQPGRILDISLKRLHSLRRSVFKDIITKSRTTENIIVNTHATFRWRHGLFPAIDFDQMKQLGAEMYICLIDGVAALHTRLAEEHFTEHTLKDLIVWREEEIIGTEMLCKGTGENKKLYCLARGEEKETIETFYKLIFEQSLKKAYLSFPMTQVVDMPAVREKINTFRNKMKRHFICFDPGDLEEAYLPVYANRARDNQQKFVEVETIGRKIKLDIEQVKQIKRDINSQTYARDFMLIDQSDMIISFIPALDDGRPAISSGVERELQHAHESAKEVFVIWKAESKPSIFVTQTATKVFENTEKALEFFRNTGFLHNDTNG